MPPARAPPMDQNFLNFMQFLGKSGKFVCWHPPGELAPPPTENPVSAPALLHGQQAGGTHPTGMLSCYELKLLVVSGTQCNTYTCTCTCMCILNSSVRSRVSSSRKRFWTLPNLYSEVSALSDPQAYSSSVPVYSN